MPHFPAMQSNHGLSSWVTDILHRGSNVKGTFATVIGNEIVLLIFNHRSSPYFVYSFNVAGSLPVSRHPPPMMNDHRLWRTSSRWQASMLSNSPYTHAPMDIRDRIDGGRYTKL